MKKLIFTLFLGFTMAGAFAQLPFSVGQLAPDFTATDYRGVTHNLYTYCSQGKYVVVDFFAHWCGPCQATAPKIDQFYHKYGCNQGNVIVLGNECDGTNAQLFTFIFGAGGDTADTYPQWSGTEGAGNQIEGVYNPAAFPTICLIGPDSTFLNTDIWPINTIADIENKFPSGVLTPMSCYTHVVDIRAATSGRLYPNPASEAFYLELDLRQAGEFTLELTDMTGRRVLVKEYSLNAGPQQVRVNTANLPMGTYLVRGLVNGEQLFTSRMNLK